MSLFPFLMEAYGEAPDIAFGAAQRKAREILPGDHATGSITHKTTFVCRDVEKVENSILLEPLSECAIRLLKASEKETRYGELNHSEGPAAYVSDGHGYYIFFGWAPVLEEK